MVDLYLNIRKASFRGLEFETLDDNSNFGRRVQTHEYPGKDTAVHEDSGLAVQSFSFTAVIRGNNYYNRSAEFESALQKAGSAKLVHPYYGEIDVIVKRVNRLHSSSKIGEILFRIEFEKYGATIYPEPIVDTAINISTATSAFFETSKEDFINNFIGSGVPDFITEDAVNRLDSFTNNVKNLIALSSLKPVIDFPNVWELENVSALASNITDLYQTISDVIGKKDNPLVGGMVVEIQKTPADIIGFVQTMAGTSDYSVAVVGSGNTASDAIRVKNSSALDLIQRSSAISATGNVIKEARYESQEQAVFIRDLFASKMDLLLDNLAVAGFDASWSAGHNLLSAISRDINVQIGRLPKTVRIKNTALRPAITIANRLYGDNPKGLFDRASDITTRNKIRHPSFVPASELEVLI